jgi:O-antigen ligase
MTTRQIALPHRSALTVLPVAAVVAVMAGMAVVSGGLARVLIVVASCVVVLLSITPWIVPDHVKHGYLAVELPLVLLLLSTLVFRLRDTEALAANPLDSAAFFRVGCVAAALLLSILALCYNDWEAPEPVRSRPFRLYGFYVVVVFIGAPLSVIPVSTAYRGLEVGAGWLVLLAAIRTIGRPAIPRIETTVYWFTVALVVSVWVGIVVFPGQAVASTDFLLGESPLPWQLVGVIPSISSNGVGTLGATLFLWSLGYRLGPPRNYGPRPRVVPGLALLGLITLIGAQYRTGYVAAAVGLLVLVVMRKPELLVGVLIAGVVAAVLWGSTILQTAEPYALRGQTAETATQMSGRLYWWENAIPVWQESPVVGKGLLTATRFEVFQEIGLGMTSGLHSTWLEALVGTGIVGAALLASALLISLRRALREALRPGGRIVPLLLLTMIAVRSVTGTTFEVFDPMTIMFLAIALSLPDGQREDSAPNYELPTRILPRPVAGNR